MGHTVECAHDADAAVQDADWCSGVVPERLAAEAQVVGVKALVDVRIWYDQRLALCERVRTRAVVAWDVRPVPPDARFEPQYAVVQDPNERDWTRKRAGDNAHEQVHCWVVVRAEDD